MGFSNEAFQARARANAVATATNAAGPIGMRAFVGRVERVTAVDTTGKTYETLMALAAPFDAIRVGIVVGQTASVTAVTPSAYVAVAALPSTADSDLTAATPTQLTSGGSGTFSLAPSAALGRRNIIWSDWTPVSSVPRTDGGSLPLLAIRVAAFLGTGSGNIITLGDTPGADSFANWATKPSGRIVRLMSKGGIWTASGAGWSGMQSSNSSAATTGLGLIVQYVARGRVVNLVGFGDSISEGRGTYIGDGFGNAAAEALSANADGIAYEWSNLAWSGQSTSQIRTNVADAVASGMFDQGGTFLAVLPSGSPNDIPTTITDALITTMRGNLARSIQSLATKRVPVIVWPWIPSNTAVKAYGATDAKRVAYAAEIRGWASRGSIIADFDATIAGTADSSGQIQIGGGLTTDNIHPNDAGNAKLSPVLQRAVPRVLLATGGMLVS